MPSESHAGFVAIVGRPNVGKSTLLNSILGKKLSITCRKQQTTRHRIHGIKTEGEYQTIYVDTPGLHRHNKRALNRAMNQVAMSALHEVDLIIFMVDPHHFREDDEWILEMIKQSKIPTILAINKIDHFHKKEVLLPILQELSLKHDFVAVLPISATLRENVENLEKEVRKHLPANPHFFPDDQLTDRDENFLVSEIIREKLFEYMHEEIPYSTTVALEKLKHENKLVFVQAVVYVETVGQKAMVIGKGGESLKTIATKARRDLEAHFGEKVYLQVWVKIKKHWVDNERFIAELGYAQDAEN